MSAQGIHPAGDAIRLRPVRACSRPTHLPSASAGSGQRVYIVDAYDDPNAEADLAAYRTQYGLPACTTANGCFQKLNQNGATSPLPPADTGWAGEISLDLDMVSADLPELRHHLGRGDQQRQQPVHRGQGSRNARRQVRLDELGWLRERQRGLVRRARYFKPPGVVYTASTGDGAYAGGVITRPPRRRSSPSAAPP